MNVLITGGAGFIGSELGKFLLSHGYNVILLDNLEYGYRDNFNDNILLEKNFILADIRDSNFFSYLENIDIIFHFAGISALPECESHPYKAFDVNTAAVSNVLNAARIKGVKRIIFASTSAVYENNDSTHFHNENDEVIPNLIYATSKYCAEKVCRSYSQNYDMDIVICRFFNVYGPHQDFKRKYPPFTSYIVKEALTSNIPTIYNLKDCKRDYIYIDDLMEYLLRILQSNKHYHAEIFNLASGNAFSAIEIANKVYQILNKEFIYKTANPLDFWNKYENLFNCKNNLNKKRVEKEVFKHCLGDNTKIIEEFNYTPKITLQDGLSNIIEYQQKLLQV